MWNSSAHALLLPLLYADIAGTVQALTLESNHLLHLDLLKFQEGMRSLESRPIMLFLYLEEIAT